MALCVCVCVCVCVGVAQAQMHKLEHSPDIRLCLRMASLIRSYVTSSVQLTSAFLVMLGSVPEEAHPPEKKEELICLITHF